MVDAVDPYGITGKYTGFCGRLNAEEFRISYRDGCMNRPSRPLTITPRALWTEPAFVFSLEWASWMYWYVGSPSTLVRKGIKKEDLMSVTFEMVLKTLLVEDYGS